MALRFPLPGRRRAEPESLHAAAEAQKEALAAAEVLAEFIGMYLHLFIATRWAASFVKPDLAISLMRQ